MLLKTLEIIKRMEWLMDILNEDWTTNSQRIKYEELQERVHQTGPSSAPREHVRVLASLGAEVFTTMDPLAQRMYLTLLRQIQGIGGNEALLVFTEVIDPIQMILVDFDMETFRSWWLDAPITTHFQDYLRILIQKSPIFDQLDKAKVWGESSLITMSDFLEQFDDTIETYNEGRAFLSPDEISTRFIEHLDHIGTGIETPIDNPTIEGGTYWREAFKHIYRTGGDEAILLCTISCSYKYLYHVDYDKQQFDEWWSSHVPTSFLAQLNQVSQKITKTHSNERLLECFRTEPE